MDTMTDTTSDSDPGTFAPATDNPRRERTTLYVVVFDVRDAQRRARVRRIVASFGIEVAPHAFEVPTSTAGARALERALSQELKAGDDARVYPVCSRCRSEARVWGDGELAGLSPALIF
jgi:CRISPR-associated endonuclease Cas2